MCKLRSRGILSEEFRGGGGKDCALELCLTAELNNEDGKFRVVGWRGVVKGNALC